MKAAGELSERVLEFSRAYFGEAKRGEEIMGDTWTSSAESSFGTEPRREPASPASKVPFAAWGGWADRGIPELASPLAD